LIFLVDPPAALVMIPDTSNSVGSRTGMKVSRINQQKTLEKIDFFGGSISSAGDDP
jgi:hypothetical protein